MMYFIRSSLILVLLSKWTHCVEPSVDYPPGDPGRCPETTYILETIPGVGFDNLDNEMKGQFLAMNYSFCRVSKDKQYLIPNNIRVIPIRKSLWKFSSDIITSLQTYSSLTSKTINAKVEVSLSFFSISGSYSSHHQSAHESMTKEKTVTVRTQFRNEMFIVLAEPDSPLYPTAKARLLDIASHLQTHENSPMARYLAQLFIRDYGTHYINSIDAGGVVALEDQISEKVRTQSVENETKMKAAASISFRNRINVKVSGSYEQKTDEKFTSEYTNNRHKSDILLFGGTPYNTEFNVSDWIDKLPNTLVAIDKRGHPIWNAITPSSFPELPKNTTLILSNLIQTQVLQYYEFNKHPGCTNRTSNKFNPSANYDDGQCITPDKTFKLGGVYQKCADGTGSGFDHGFCYDNQQSNSKTGTYDCPQFYTAVLIYEHNGPFEIKKNSQEVTQGHLYTYWCKSDDDTVQSIYQFGGVFSATTVNRVTHRKSCPTGFFSRHFAGGFICLGEAETKIDPYTNLFGGFYSCMSENPLSLKESKSCYPGYSLHLMHVVNNCPIHYCMQSKPLQQSILGLQRPPYIAAPIHPNDNMYLRTRTGAVWKENYLTSYINRWNQEVPGSDNDDKTDFANDTTAAVKDNNTADAEDGSATTFTPGLVYIVTGIVAGVLVLLVLIITVGVVVGRRVKLKNTTDEMAA